MDERIGSCAAIAAQRPNRISKPIEALSAGSMSDSTSNPIGGDDWFVAELTRNQRSIYVLILAAVHARSDADDIYQSVCMTLWRRRADYDPASGTFKAWAKGIARNQIRSYVRTELRRQRRIMLSEELTNQLLDIEDAHASSYDERAEALQKCLARLQSEQRRLIEQYYQRRNTVAELSKLFNMGSRSLYRRVDQIRVALLNCVMRQWGGGVIE